MGKKEWLGVKVVVDEKLNSMRLATITNLIFFFFLLVAALVFTYFKLDLLGLTSPKSILPLLVLTLVSWVLTFFSGQWNTLSGLTITPDMNLGSPMSGSFALSIRELRIQMLKKTSIREGSR